MNNAENIIGQLDEAGGDSSNPSHGQALRIDERRVIIIEEEKFEQLKHEEIDQVKQWDDTNLFDGLEIKQVDDEQLKF